MAWSEKPAWVPPGVSAKKEARRQCGATEKAQTRVQMLQSQLRSGEGEDYVEMSLNLPAKLQFPHLQNEGQYPATSLGRSLDYTIMYVKAPHKG